MPKLSLRYAGSVFECDISKVDRSKLYGTVSEEVLDENEGVCTMATLASDGMTLIPAGGTAFGYVSEDGFWRDKADLTPTDLDGSEITPVTSTFKETVELSDPVDIETLLSHNIRLAYLLSSDDFAEALAKELKGGAIFQFPFSYRGGLQADAAFILMSSDGNIWMAVGKPTKIQLIGFEQAAGLAVEEGESDDAEDDLMDFGMM